ncbi:diguanylate cyclase (GGDEF)-like protein [Hydrogenothermus marinus]|uniref:diguanylate cyclase n=1 Tax=Hydrogenothermus marinus TaxID=133270 RepID=A0A3M0B6K6_9AQUI|nr:diguanylate cyclase (GGDEF)-like protein [Hydrogenothermus marinus]
MIFTTIAHLIGIINLPYKPISYITFYLAIFLIIYIGNSFIKETVNTLNLLYEVANFDTLTNVYNRRKLYEILEYEIEKVKRYKRPLSLMIIDIDDFKKINDTYGHNFGDEILKEVAKILKSNIRKIDYVGRLGGEEFLVILPETTKEEAFFVGEKLRSAVERYFEANYGKKLTISIGISELDESLLCNEDCKLEKIILDLIEVADKSLYIAKRNGKNMVIIS